MFKGVIPTDNLYKFLAIFGLAIILASLLSFALLTPDLNELMGLLQSKSMIEAALPQAGIEGLFEATLKLKSAVFFTKLVVLGISLVVGLIISGLGFFSWYAKKQALEDVLLSMEVAKRTQLATLSATRSALLFVDLAKKKESLDPTDREKAVQFFDAWMKFANVL